MKRCSPPRLRISSWPGPQKEMIGIGEDDLRVQFLGQVALREPFDGGLRADRHEDGRFDVAVRGVEETGASARCRALGQNVEGHEAYCTGASGILGP